MKKEDITGMIVYILILGLAIVFGLTVLQEYSKSIHMKQGEFILLVVGALATGVVFNSVLYELAHMLGAKIGRYDILSVNILGICFYKAEGRTKIKFSAFDGLTGETKINPKKDAEKEPNPTPYLLFGTLFYVVEIIAVVLAFSFLTAVKNLTLNNVGYFLLIVGALGGLILLYNIMPFKLDSINDGYRLTMTTNAKNKIAFNELLRVENAIAAGDSEIEIKTFDQITNFTAELNLNKVYLLLEEQKYKEAEELLDIILGGKTELTPKVYIRARAQKIYINLITKSLEDAKEFYEKEVDVQERREISNDISMPSIRTYILMAGLLDKSRSETILALNKVLKAYKKTPKKRQRIEMKLYNEALNMVIEAHPTWEIEGYILVDTEA